MKKVLLLSLSLVLGFSAIAQQRVMKDDARMSVASSKKALAGKELPGETVATYAPQTAQSYVLNRMLDSLDQETMVTYYDLQSNQYVANRMYQLPNGSVAVTATMSHENNQTASDRGTGYAFYDGAANAWTTINPDNRIESFKTGWPSIAQFGENGEILLAHGNSHMQCFIRTTAGQGAWTYVGALPDYPEGYAYTTEYPTWPRIVTCGDNHNIAVAVAVLQHSISTDETDLQTVMWRSENPADINSWTISYGPLHDLPTPWDHNQFSADDYCMAANGHNVALLYSGCLTNSTWLFKSTDDGLNWDATRVWENPYEGREFDEEPAWGMEDTLFMPMNGSVVIDNNGVTHVALNTFEMAHTLDNDPGYYSYWSGRAVDGILYWNDTQVAPIQSPDGNPHHAARLWWPDPENPGYVHMDADSTRWIGFIPMFYDENGSLISFENDHYYHSGTEYISKFYGASGHPALSCDPNGNLACAFSSPCTYRTDERDYYYRSIFVSYYNVEEGYWRQDEDDLLTDPMLLYGEAAFTNAVSNTINVGEFWFGYQVDDEIGFYWGSNASQATGTENWIHAYKIVADPEFVNVNEFEAVNPMTNTRVYPNPVTDMLNIEVNASQASEMNISVFNIMGQKVAEENVTISTGLNTNSINTENLSNGIYFVTVKANGFENTMKFIVK